MTLSPGRLYLLLTIGAVGFIVYGSLYPFALRPTVVADPLAALWATRTPSLAQAGNLLGNILFYLPLGLFGAAALKNVAPRTAPVIMIVAAAALSSCMEYSQFHIAGRVSTFNDIYPNVMGAAVGAFAAPLLYVSGTIGLRGGLWNMASIPGLLIAVFLAYRLFPYLPSVDLQQYWRALKPVWLAPRLDSFAVVSYALRWLVIAELLRQITRAWDGTRWLLLMIIAVLVAKIVIVNNHLSPNELIGAASAILVSAASVSLGARLRCLLLAGALSVLIAAERLQPFVFVTQAQSFGWIPFGSLLHGSMAVNAIAVLEKLFLYGSAIWLWQRTGARLLLAGSGVALMLIATSLAETHLPGRSAESTDAVIALLLTAVFAAVARPGHSQPVDSPQQIRRSQRRTRG